MTERDKERDGSVFIVLCRRTLRLGIAKIIWFDIICVTAYLMFTFWVPLVFDGAAVTALYFSVSAAADVFIVYRLIKTKTEKYKSFAEIIYGMGISEFDGLCKQAETSGFKFNTLFLLDDCIFIPSETLLLEYTDISDIKTTYHVTKIEDVIPVYDSAEMLITCFNGKKYKLNMKKIHEFKETYDEFFWLLNLKRKNSFERKNVQNLHNDLEVLK
ncbi:MAG: hypothetical protein NC253_04425 [Ruminococcus sp.]|nr:hypothetical protein [Ruminococcus sp.]MCM1382612.1 hypothetical protein [Muribaculaceae bacterium]MCM1480538.1 hypothetical protein [Muribaculaceae bacterium]